MLRRLWKFQAEMVEDVGRPFVQFAKNSSSIGMSTPAKLNSVAEKVDKIANRAEVVDTPERNASIATNGITSIPAPAKPFGTPVTLIRELDPLSTPEKAGSNPDSGFSTPGSNKRKRASAIQPLEGRKRVRVEPDLDEEIRPATLSTIGCKLLN
jgi:hypothetical protein